MGLRKLPRFNYCNRTRQVVAPVAIRALCPGCFGAEEAVSYQYSVHALGSGAASPVPRTAPAAGRGAASACQIQY